MLRWLAGGLLLFLALFGALGASAQELRPIPKLDARVIDQTGTLDEAQRAALENKLAAFEHEAGPQIVVLIVPSTQPEDIAAFAYRVADAWKIGRREVGDGVLIVVAKDDRRVRIEVAKALEGAIPDLAARQIIDRAIRPAFRQGEYAGGLSAAIDQLIARIKGENLPAPLSRDREAGPQWEELGLFFFVAVPILGAVLTGVFGRKLGSLFTGGAAAGIAWWLSASLLIAAGAAIAALVLVGVVGFGSSAARSLGRHGGRRGPVIFGTGGFGGGSGWGGGSSGGGFSSGGGGDFGGGGASGDW